jgi:predicted DNA-binding WGR domain protein
MAFLTRTDPTRNIDRFYVVDITPTLFGEWAVLREWGRRGSPVPCASTATGGARRRSRPSSARSSAACSGVTRGATITGDIIVD